MEVTETSLTLYATGRQFIKFATMFIIAHIKAIKWRRTGWACWHENCIHCVVSPLTHLKKSCIDVVFSMLYEI